VLTLLYQLYLSQFNVNDIDAVTRLVARQTKQLMSVFKVNFEIQSYPGEDFLRLIYNGSYVARMIEGCNAISILILFVSFIFSFSGKAKVTVLFIIVGSCIIYFLNVTRIALLCILMYHFPEKEGLLHGVLFPLFIYGVVFLLWLIWVNKHATYGKRNP
jgi:exosortase family protein XrtF